MMIDFRMSAFLILVCPRPVKSLPRGVRRATPPGIAPWSALGYSTGDWPVKLSWPVKSLAREVRSYFTGLLHRAIPSGSIFHWAAFDLVMSACQLFSVSAFDL
jgi:hypothetical protein